MSIEPGSRLITDFLGSAHIFAFAVAEVLEKHPCREVAGDQFSVQQLKLLRLVNMAGPHTIGDVAAFLGISNAAASKAVDRLVNQMLLRRNEGEHDRRATHLSLTGPGRRVLDDYDSAVRRKLAEILAQYSANDLRSMIEMLDRLSAQIVGYHEATEEMCVQCGIYFSDKCILRQRLNTRCHYERQRERSMKRGRPGE